MNKTYKNVYHLSHIDLDGYCSQLSSTKFYEDHPETNLHYFSGNYGKSLEEQLKIILKLIKRGDQLLITDLNLEADVAEKIEFHRNLSGFDVQLLDHHGTGKTVAAEYDWYHLDESKCGTKLTYEYFFPKGNDSVSGLVELVDIYDLYKEEHEDFEIAKTLNQVMWDNKRTFPQGISKYDINFFLFIIEKAYALYVSGSSIPEIEREMYSVKRSFFLNGKIDSGKSLHILKIDYIYDEVIKDNEIFESFEFNGSNGMIFFDIGDIFQEFSHNVLNDSPDVDFVVNLTSGGRLAVRSRKDGFRADKFCKTYFSGGGHRPASGGKLNFRNNKRLKQEVGFKYFYEDLGLRTPDEN